MAANIAGQKLPPYPQQGIDAKWASSLVQAVNDAYAYACSTATRPPNPFIGFSLFDTTLGKPIWCKSLNPVRWVDATGAVV